MTKLFLGLVGAMYVLLGVYCSILPSRASKAVGLEITPGSGQSEFLTVYGGLEVGLGLIFLWPLFRPAELEFALRACLIVHACLVLFRTVGFFAYTNFDPTTYKLAAGEWVILLFSAFLWWRMHRA